MSEKAVLEYERHMYHQEFHRISYVLDDFIREVNKHWVNQIKIADSQGDEPFPWFLIICIFVQHSEQ